MALVFIKKDITEMKVDAIVNAANNSLLGGGGVDGAIHRAAGPKLLEECRTLNGCETGEAKITKGYDLPAKYVIHTVGPVWRGGRSGEPELLKNCYMNSLKIAVEYKVESIAFPMISTGVYGYPHDKAMNVAVNTITEFLKDNDMKVFIVFYGSRFGGRSEYISRNNALTDEVDRYINRRGAFHNTDDEPVKFSKRVNRGIALQELENICCESEILPLEAEDMPFSAGSAPKAGKTKKRGIFKKKDLVIELDEGPKEMLVRLIDKSGMKSGDLCMKANIDRKVISKIRNDEKYNPSKPMLLAFCIGLQLDLRTTNELLSKAGYLLSNSSMFDVIVKYFIENGIYDIYDLNIELFNRDQRLLGSA